MTTKTNTKKAVAKVAPVPAAVAAESASTALATTNMPDILDLFTQDAAAAPHFDRSERSMPFLRIAQGLSPQRKKTEPSYIPGLEEGDFFNTLTNRVWSGETGLLFLPAYYTKNYAAWKPRTMGGGLQKDYGADREASGIDQAVRNPDTSRLQLNGLDIVESSVYYGLILDQETGDYEEAVLYLSSTQLPKSRKWNALIHQQVHPRTKARLPLFARAYHLTTTAEKNDRGSWSGLQVAAGPMINEFPRWDVLYLGAKMIHDDFTKGPRIVTADVVDAEVVTPVAAADDASYAAAGSMDGDEDGADFDVE